MGKLSSLKITPEPLLYTRVYAQKKDFFLNIIQKYIGYEVFSTYIFFFKVDSFLQWAATSFQSSIAIINHEQLNIFDKFGQVMLENLSQRGCSLPGIEACRNKTSHIDRLLTNGWNNGYCWTMNEIYNMKLPKEEIERVEKIEFLDEKELVSQLFEHYCVSYGWKSMSMISLDDMEFW